VTSIRHSSNNEYASRGKRRPLRRVAIQRAGRAPDASRCVGVDRDAKVEAAGFGGRPRERADGRFAR
jgi:hypothetical protein